jgi:flagellar basal body-associated protein FliL
VYEVKKKKKNLYNLYIYILFTIIILGLSGYLVYDKFFEKNSSQSNTKKEIQSYDLYAVKVDDRYITIAFIRDNKLYYGHKESKCNHYLWAEGVKLQPRIFMSSIKN